MNATSALRRSPSLRRSLSLRRAVCAGAVAVTTVTGGLAGTSGTAHADEVSTGGKGIVGGGLLGADVVTGTMGIIGVHNTWFYVVGGAVGAGGGAVGGWAVQNASSDGRAPMYLLAGGLALLIPAAVLTLDATRYQPSDDATEDKAPTNGPAADPGQVGGSAVVGPNGAPSLAPPPSAPAPDSTSPAVTTPAGGGSGSPAPAAPPAAPPTSMFHYEGGQLRIGVPVPEVRPMYTALEQKTLGVSGTSTQVQMPMLKVRF